MSWSNQGGGGPWKPGGSGPWGQGPGSGGGGQTPPDLEEFIRRSQTRLKGLFPQGSLGGLGIAAVVLVVALLWLASGFYTVAPNEVGINLVFGRYTGKTAAGLNYNLPYPVGDVVKLAVTDRKAIDIGSVSGADLRRAGLQTSTDVPQESLMLTGDDNIADVKFRVIWQIDPEHPEYYAFNLRHPDDTVKAVSESAMREVIGRSQIQNILTSGRKTIEPDVQKLTQGVLNQYKAGILVLQVQLLSVDPPQQVISAFRDVTAAQQDQQRLRNEAESYANRVVPEARGSAAAIEQEAQGYRTQTVQEAQGQAARFGQVYDQYKNAPDITRERIYIETMESILAGADKTIIDRTGAGVLPLLPLGADKALPGAGGAAMRIGGSIAAALAVLLLVVLGGTLFTVDQTEQALVLYFGQPARVIDKPGLHAKIPFFETVVDLDNRILDLESDKQEVLASDNQRILVDAFLRYHIADPLKFFQTVGSVDRANNQLGSILNSALRRVLGEATLPEIVSVKRAELMVSIRDLVDAEGARLGVAVNDVRIRRADLPAELSEKIYGRMQSERNRQAAEYRAQGSEQAQTIKARADRDVVVLRAEAQKNADILRGQGDADRNRIFAEAYGKDAKFFAFYRSMQAYAAALKPDRTRLVLAPDSDFFRFFNDPGGRVGAPASGEPGPTATPPALPPPATPAPDGGSTTAPARSP